MITTERVRHSGALVLTALVTDGSSFSDFYYSRTYYDYALSEAKAMFRDSLTRDGLRIVRD